MAGRIWDGDDVAQRMLRRMRDEVASLLREGRSPPTLVEIRVGDSSLPHRLQVLQEDACRLSGISYQVCALPGSSDYRTIAPMLAELNADPRVTGITIQAPASVSWAAFAGAVAPEKDVDGWHPLNLGRLVITKRAQRRARGMEVVHLLQQAGVELRGAHVICIGDVRGLAGVFALLCLHENATVTAWRDSRTRLSEELPSGDVVLIDTEDWPMAEDATFKSGAVIIDARHLPPGPPWPPYQKWLEVVSLLIPLPDGVGPATVALRLSSLVSLYRAHVCKLSVS